MSYLSLLFSAEESCFLSDPEVVSTRLGPEGATVMS